MPLYKVNVKWQKERFKAVECNTDESPDIFKAVLFSLTGVPPERQKVMMPGKILGSTDYEGIKLKDGATIMLMGTTEEIPKVDSMQVVPTEMVSSIEKVLQLPFGLVNLGNTCYMNAALQLLYNVPEIRAVVKLPIQPQFPSGMASSPQTLLVSLRELFRSMEKAREPVIPAVFVTCLRAVCPQFATRASTDSEAPGGGGGAAALLGGRFAQQDANECWVELMHVLQRISVDPKTSSQLPDLLKSPSSTSVWDPIERYFSGRLSTTLTCTEAEEEEPSQSVETFTQLSCFINQDVKFLHTGIRNGFEGVLTKHSASLSRDATYKKKSVLTRLPAYLSVHFVRFFYKENKQVNAKILKDIKFPMELDLFSFCSPELQQELNPMREAMRVTDDRVVHAMPQSGKPANKIEKPANPVTSPELFEPFSLPDDPGSNNCGMYELMGVLSHQGRTSSSGHYVSWVKQEENWLKFDDDVVTLVQAEDILRLSGGGDWHCAYNLLYGPKRMRKDTGEDATQVTDMETAASPQTTEHAGNGTTKLGGDQMKS